MPVSVGLDIGTSAVRVAQIASGGRGPDVLQRVAEVPLPPDAVRDGEIVDPDAVVAALKELWARHRIGSRKVALGVANQQVVVRQLEVPSLPPRELRQSLEFQAADAIPIPLEHAILDFHLLGTAETAGGELMSSVLLVAAQRGMVETVVDVVRRARLEPTVLDLDAFAALRSLSPATLLGGGELLVDCGAGVTNVVVADAGAPRFVRILRRGGRAITVGLADVMGVDEAEADVLKSIAAPPGTAVPGEPSDSYRPPSGPLTTTSRTGEIARVVAEHAGRLAEDLRGSLDFYAAQHGAVPVRRVVLSGGTSRLPGLRERIAEALRLPVDTGHPLQELRMGKRVGLGPEDLLAAEAHLAVAVGLAISRPVLREHRRTTGARR